MEGTHPYQGVGSGAQAALRDSTSRAQLVARVAERFMALEPEDFDQGITWALAAVGEFTDVDRAYCFELSESRLHMSNTHEWCAPGIKAAAAELQGVPTNTFPWFEARCLQQGHVISVPRVADLPVEAVAERAEWTREGIQSLLCVPLESAGRVIGFLGLDAVHAQRSWSERAVELLRSVGGMIVGALNHRRTRRALKETETEQRKARDRQARLSTAISQVADAVMILNEECILEYVNPAFERATGYSIAEAVGQPWRFLHHSEQAADFYQAIHDMIHAGDVWMGRLPMRRKDGSPVLMDSTVSPVHGSNGQIVNFVAVQRDITHDAQIEEQLRQVQKMEAVGMLAGGIAHDFNNLLIAIIGHSELLLMRASEDENIIRHAEEIRKAGDRAKALTSQLLAFSRKQVLRPRVLDLGCVIEELGDLLHRVIGEDIEVSIVPAAEPATILADPGQMEQVVMNLVTNARDAMAGGGALLIGLDTIALSQERASHHATLRPGPHVLLTVSDSGDGMDEATKARIFEPFFTTKDMGKGTGLGLATVYGIVRQSGGAIEVETAPGRGTTIRVLFPHLDQPADDIPTPRGLRAPAEGDEVILVVEDEPSVASIVRSTLRSHGYTVLYASNGRRALELLDSYRGPLHLLFTDVVMPEMGGVELASELTDRLPDLKVLYCSGYTDSALLSRGALIRGVELLSKPFSPATLVQRVRETLDLGTAASAPV